VKVTLTPQFANVTFSVADNAEIWINEQRKHGVISAIKHFPGHGSSNTDTHLGIANVSKTWTKDELIPYAKLIEKNNVDMIMTSHVFNAAIDSLYPATLSYKTLTLLLRKQMNFNGVIITDDLAMGAMTKHYSLDEIVELSILAGADMLCLSNNGTVYDQDIVPKVINIIYTKVKNGIIPEERINESYLRITNLKKKIK
jgi:beta-N-acetylhexosaminidase